MAEQNDLRKLILFGAAILVGIVLLVLVISALSSTISTRNNAGRGVQDEPASAPPASLFTLPLEAAENIDYRVIPIPDEADALLNPPYKPSRERKLQWDFPDIANFWTDPMEIATEALNKENSEKLRRLLERVD